MKKIAKKSLSIVLALIMVTALFVPAFAADPGTDQFLAFSADIDYDTNQLSFLYFVVEGYTVFKEDTFACSIYDSLGNEVFNETMGEYSYTLSGEMDMDDTSDFIWADIHVWDTVILDPDETYTFVIAAGSFDTVDGTANPELTFSFLASDYIYVPTILDRILWFLHSNPVLEFVFARLIIFLELFYYIPFIGFPLLG